MAKKISVTLSSKSIRDAIKELEKYRDSLERKNEIFVKRLKEIGINVITSKIAQARTEDDKDLYIEDETKALKSVVVARIRVTGKMILFIEFGAGVFYNQGNAHPLASQFGYGVGTYPGQTHAEDDFWFFIDENGDKHMSHGTEATMPLYNAYREMYIQVLAIAREVFGS